MALLWHHGHRSDEYFSRWIALKEGKGSAWPPRVPALANPLEDDGQAAGKQG
jgi:hypothetical protein